MRNSACRPDIFWDGYMDLCRHVIGEFSGEIVLSLIVLNRLEDLLVEGLKDPKKWNEYKELYNKMYSNMIIDHSPNELNIAYKVRKELKTEGPYPEKDGVPPVKIEQSQKMSINLNGKRRGHIQRLTRDSPVSLQNSVAELTNAVDQLSRVVQQNQGPRNDRSNVTRHGYQRPRYNRSNVMRNRNTTRDPAAEHWA